MAEFIVIVKGCTEVVYRGSVFISTARLSKVELHTLIPSKVGSSYRLCIYKKSHTRLHLHHLSR